MSLPELERRSRIIVYSRPGCHLCELLIEELAPLVRGKLKLEVRDIDTRPEWKLKYGVLIPLVEYRGETVCHHHLDAAAVRKILESLPAS